MKSQILAGACSLALAACASTPLPDATALSGVSNIAVTSTVVYQNPLAGYTYRGPTGPRDWREVNQEQTEGN
jgi:hypothetical protein